MNVDDSYVSCSWTEKEKNDAGITSIFMFVQPGREKPSA